MTRRTDPLGKANHLQFKEAYKKFLTADKIHQLPAPRPEMFRLDDWEGRMLVRIATQEMCAEREKASKGGGR